MNALETLFFPDTTISTDRQFPLFLFFSPLHIIKPVEGDENEKEKNRPTDTFMDKGFCQVHTPAPLGEDRERFLHLINDIKNRKDDYAAQLSALTVASMSTPGKQSDDSKGAIVSSLLGTSGIQQENKAQNAALEKLWQARLVLKIAEILDQEEEEIAHALTFLDDTELDLFNRLQGKDGDFPEDNPYEDLMQLRKRLNQPRRETIKNRFRSWKILQNLLTHPDCRMWTTTREEAADIVLEMYEKKTGEAALPLFKTFLPARTGMSTKESLEKITAFKEEAHGLLLEISENLEKVLQQETVNGSIAFLPDEETWEEKWKTLLEIHFPESSYGRTPLSFHLLANRQPASLFTETTGKASGPQGLIAVFG